MKTAQTNKMNKQDQNTNRGHPPNSIQVCPVTQVELWRNKGTGEKEKGEWGEAREMETKDD